MSSSSWPLQQHPHTAFQPFFLATHTDALDVLVLGLVPIAVIGKVYQNISPNGASIANVVELSQGASQLSFFPLLGKFGDSMARLRVEASSEVLSPSRLSLTFKSAGFEPVTLFGMEVGKQLSLPKVREGGREGGERGEGGREGGERGEGGRSRGRGNEGEGERQVSLSRRSST